MRAITPRSIRKQAKKVKAATKGHHLFRQVEEYKKKQRESKEGPAKRPSQSLHDDRIDKLAEFQEQRDNGEFIVIDYITHEHHRQYSLLCPG